MAIQQAPDATAPGAAVQRDRFVIHQPDSPLDGMLQLLDSVNGNVVTVLPVSQRNHLDNCAAELNRWVRQAELLSDRLQQLRRRVQEAIS